MKWNTVLDIVAGVIMFTIMILILATKIWIWLEPGLGL